MDTELQGNPEVKPPPSQETLDSILSAVDKLASTGSFVGTSWNEIFWLDPLKGWDKYSRLFVSRLTERGRKVYPDNPEAEIEFLSRDELGKRQIAYHIHMQDQELKLTKHDSLTTVKEEKDEKNNLNRLIRGSREEKKRAMDRILEESKYKEKSRGMENETGVSYVDTEEAETLLSDLRKLIEQEHPN
ncbi:MAG: hypothetical protein ABH812_01145 [bacterium]